MTLQEKYNAIKEGKGNKKQFLVEAKRDHSDVISNITSYEKAVSILKNKSIINESMFYADLKPITQFQPANREPFENLFADFLIAEAKAKEDEAVKAEEKKTSKVVMQTQENNYDYADPKKVDNQIGQEVLDGIYLEVQKDPQITKEAAMKNVMKNLEKDKTYYVKNGQFGVEGLGYQEPVQEEVTGDYAYSGYSAKLKKVVKEHLGMGAGVVTSGNPNSYASKSGEMINQMMAEMEGRIGAFGQEDDYAEEMTDSMECKECGMNPCGCEGHDHNEDEMDVTVIPLGEDGIEETPEDLAVDLSGENDDEGIEEEAIMADEEPAIAIPKRKSNKKQTLQKRMSEIEKLGTSLALEAKMEALDEEIVSRQDQIAMLDENEAMAALMDPKKLKEITNEIKLLEKKKSQYQKMHDKASKSAKKNDE